MIWGSGVTVARIGGRVSCSTCGEDCFTGWGGRGGVVVLVLAVVLVVVVVEVVVVFRLSRGIPASFESTSPRVFPGTTGGCLIAAAAAAEVEGLLVVMERDGEGAEACLRGPVAPGLFAACAAAIAAPIGS